MARRSMFPWLATRDLVRNERRARVSRGAEREVFTSLCCSCHSRVSLAALCPRNDLESVGYLLAECLGGKAALPWHAATSLRVRALRGEKGGESSGRVVAYILARTANPPMLAPPL